MCMCACACVRIWACGVVVSVFDFHQSDRGSNPGRGGEIFIMITTTLYCGTMGYSLTALSMWYYLTLTLLFTSRTPVTFSCGIFFLN